MEPFNPIFRIPKRKPKQMNAPPYCKRDFPCLPLEDACLPLPLKMEVSDPTKIMYFLENLSGVTAKELEFDINTYLRHECAASDVFLIHLMKSCEQARVIMVSDRLLEQEIMYHLPNSILKKIITFDGENYVCAEELDPEIRKLVKKVLGRKGDHIYIVPVICRCRRERDEDLGVHGNPVLLVCLVNCERSEYAVLKSVQELFRYCITTLLNTMEFEEQKRLKENCHNLLTATRELFLNIHDLTDLLREIMNRTKILTGAERCSLFLIDPDHLHLVTKVFDEDSCEANLEVKIARDEAIAAHVAATARTLNITNAYEHPLFYKGTDAEKGYKTRNILCFPIFDEHGVVGVAQLSNKIGGSFDVFDEEIVESFSINCGIALMHSMMFRKMEDELHRTQIAAEILTYNIEVTLEDIAEVICCKNCHQTVDFESFTFIPRVISDHETVCYVLKMFEELEFLERFKIRKQVLVTFFLYIKKGYRDVPYHNWKHGFSTGHFAYLCLKNLELIEKQYISWLEGFALLIAAFCHDLDHRGVSYTFPTGSSSTLASLYASEWSMDERHHLAQTLCTLNHEGCNFLEGLSAKEYKLCLNLIKDLVMATDLVCHFKLLPKQRYICVERYQNHVDRHRYYLCALIMTAADLSDYTKNWLHTKKVARYIYAEYFHQGDLEKEMGFPPVTTMDRDQAFIPELQVTFMTEICLPVYKILEVIFPDCGCMYQELEMNIKIWEKLKDYFFLQMNEGIIPYDVLCSDELEAEGATVREQIEAGGETEESEEGEGAIPDEEEDAEYTEGAQPKDEAPEPQESALGLQEPAPETQEPAPEPQESVPEPQEPAAPVIASIEPEGAKA